MTFCSSDCLAKMSQNYDDCCHWVESSMIPEFRNGYGFRNEFRIGSGFRKNSGLDPDIRNDSGTDPDLAFNFEQIKDLAHFFSTFPIRIPLLALHTFLQYYWTHFKEESAM